MIVNFTTKDLTEKQKDAVLSIEQPTLVVAVAGSGKTRVIINKIQYLLSLGYNQNRIAAITFTNKAAKEMLQRISTESPFNFKYVCTFHSFCLRLLKQYSSMFEVDPNFIIIDEDDQKEILSDIIGDNSMMDKYEVKQYIDRMKNGFGSFKSQISYDSLFEQYSEYCKKNNVLDFNDLILKVVEKLENNEEIKKYFNEMLQYILVDEYQDVNNLQNRLLKVLVSGTNITAVGDEDQSIYKFRGADVGNIMDFEKHFVPAKIIFMDENFRSTSRIIQYANNVITKNMLRRDKLTLSVRNEEGECKVVHCKSEQQQASLLCMKINELISQGYSYNNIAVLYRANWQSAQIETQFFQQRIPYRLLSGSGFYSRKEIKYVFYYIGFIMNPVSLYPLKKIINYPKRKIGEKTFETIEEEFSKEQYSLISILQHSENKKIKDFYSLIEKLQSAKTITQFLEYLLEDGTFYKEWEGEGERIYDERKENTELLRSIIVEFETTKVDATLSDFYNHFVLFIDNENENENSVKLGTFHSAKGLEFSAVFICGVNDGIIPYIRKDEEVDEEEERRLYYVGITRAKDYLYMITYNWGRFNNDIMVPSRFIPGVVSKKVSKEPLNIGDTVLIKNKGKGTIIGIKSVSHDLMLYQILMESGITMQFIDKYYTIEKV